MTYSNPVDRPTVDREKLCPFLLRMYYNVNSFHRVDQFTPTSTPPAQDELQLYTWKNATLGEIATLVQQAIPEVINQSLQAYRDDSANRRRGGRAVGPPKYVRLQFRVLTLDRNRAAYVARDVGTVYLEPEVSSPPPPAQTQSSSPTQEEKPDSDIEWVISTVQPSKALEKTLDSISFVTGDYVDIAIMIRSGDQPPRGSGSRPGGVESGGPGPISGGRDRRRRDRERRGGRDRDRRRDDRSHGGGGGGGGSGINPGRPGGDRFAGRLGALNPDVDGDWKRAQHEMYTRR